MHLDKTRQKGTLTGMATNRILSDTTPEAERVLVDLIRRAPAWRRLEMMNQMTLACRELALCGVRQRHQSASDEELRRMLAAVLLGPEVAARVYGWDPEKDGY